MRTAWIVVATSLGVASGSAGPAAADQQNPWQVIEQLELSGYNVNIDRIGNAPIGDCVVTGIRNPQQITERIPDNGREHHRDEHRGVIEVVVRQSISVSLDCTH